MKFVKPPLLHMPIKHELGNIPQMFRNISYSYQRNMDAVFATPIEVSISILWGLSQHETNSILLVAVFTYDFTK